MSGNTETSNEQSRVTTKVTNSINCDANLVCIQYPGIVKNVEKAIETLGGMTEIELATSSVKKNLELRFSTKDLYRKPCSADKDLKPSLLVKVKTRKKIKDGKVIEGSEEVVDYNVEGITGTIFKFQRLCDFQYLPLAPKETNCSKEDELQLIYKQLIPDSLPDCEWITSEEAESMPLFYPPPAFSRHNTTDNKLHFDRSKFYEGKVTPVYYKKLQEQEVLRKRRDRKVFRPYGGFVCNFEDDVPTSPPQFYIDRLKIKYVMPDAIEKLKKCFEERPIWSRLSLLYTTKVPIEQLKHILPTLAYYYMMGPWRVMWVKFGYEPKKDPSARIYQTFDYRVRTSCGFKFKVNAKRSCWGPINYKDSRQKSLCVEENMFRLRPGLIPGARQMNYQFCDIKLPQIEAMIARLPDVLPDAVCHPKIGWLPSGFHEQCREITDKYIGAKILLQMQTDKLKTVEETNQDAQSEQSPDEYFEISSSSSDSESDGEVTQEPETMESDDEIDMETVEEVNQIINLSLKNNPSTSTSK